MIAYLYMSTVVAALLKRMRFARHNSGVLPRSVKADGFLHPQKRKPNPLSPFHRRRVGRKSAPPELS